MSKEKSKGKTKEMAEAYRKRRGKVQAKAAAQQAAEVKRVEGGEAHKRAVGQRPGRIVVWSVSVQFLLRATVVGSERGRDASDANLHEVPSSVRKEMIPFRYFKSILLPYHTIVSRH